MGVLQTKVNNAVKRDIGSESGTGEGAENCSCSKSLFHFEVSPNYELRSAGNGCSERQCGIDQTDRQAFFKRPSIIGS